MHLFFSFGQDNEIKVSKKAVMSGCVSSKAYLRAVCRSMIRRFSAQQPVDSNTPQKSDNEIRILILSAGYQVNFIRVPSGF